MASTEMSHRVGFVLFEKRCSPDPGFEFSTFFFLSVPISFFGDAKIGLKGS